MDETTEEPTGDHELGDEGRQDSSDLTPEELEDLDAADPTARTIAYSGQDFDVLGLVRRLEDGDILIPHFGHSDEQIVTSGFQRAFVWNKRQMDRFIESILLGYPIPGIFLIKQVDERYLVLDGQQRLTTLRRFQDGVHAGREFVLQNVASQFKGLSYKSLPADLRRRYQDTFMQATVVSADGTSESLESVYQIFERLNAGGALLTAHEIRVALYAGPFIEYLVELNQDSAWRALYGGESRRLRDQELVLRILALFHDSEHYRRPQKTFLNGFTGTHRFMEGFDPELTRDRFSVTCNLILEGTGEAGVRLGGRQVNAALTEAICVGLMRRVASKSTPSPATTRDIISGLHRDESFIHAVSRATADEEQVRTRLRRATTAFED